MFYKCTSLTTLNLSSFNTDSAEDRDSLLYECSSLQKVTTNDKYIKKWCEDNKVIVLSPNKEEKNIED